jgi:hypothetical protein
MSDPDVYGIVLNQQKNAITHIDGEALSSPISVGTYDKEFKWDGNTYTFYSADKTRAIKKSGGGKKNRAKTVKKGGKRKGNAWTKLVTKTYKSNHKKNKNYSFKQAIQDSRKIYKKVENNENQ